MASSDNVAGHEARLKKLTSTLPPDKVASAYVGGGAEYDPVPIGWVEEEVLRRHAELDGANVADVGCGVGRLTRYMLEAGVKSYLGIDILDPILDEARKVAAGRPEFRFENVRNFTIPVPDGSLDVVCGFSLITHLLDEETYRYFEDAARVISPNGLIVFSFLDFAHKRHQEMFKAYAKTVHTDLDLLKFFEKATLQKFAKMCGLKVIEILDGGTPFKASGARPTYIDGRPAPATVATGQSLCYMRKASKR